MLADLEEPLPTSATQVVHHRPHRGTGGANGGGIRIPAGFGGAGRAGGAGSFTRRNAGG